MTTSFDPSALSPTQIAAAAAEGRRRDIAQRDRLLKSLPNMSDDELRAAISAYEDASGTDNYDCERSYEPEHNQGTQSNCVGCAGRAILEHREHVARSKQPGENPHTHIPGVQGSTYFTGIATELRVGDAVTHNPSPGSDRTEYVEAVVVNIGTDVVRVAWRRTNDAQSPVINATYEPGERVHISRLTVYKKRDPR